jgi:ribonuclease Z
MTKKNKSRTKVVFLGTGNPNPDPHHNGPSLAVIVDQTPYIVDFGIGLVRQAAALTPEFGGELPELSANHLKTGFLTHLHSDHTLGLPDLILTPWIMERNETLLIFGPKGTRSLTDHILSAYQDDIQYRLKDLEPTNKLGYTVDVKEISGGSIYKDKYLEVEAFEVSHGSMQHAYGFRFNTPDKTIVISGDTSPCENIISFGQGADILIHEVYSYKGFRAKSKLWKQYHSTHHTSSIEVAQIANITKPKLLVLYHTLYWGATDAELLSEVKSIYRGDVLISSDLMVVT